MLKKIKGFSLLEVLVVLSIFAILAVVATQFIFLTLRASRKSDVSSRVRENVDFALATMERQLHNATEISPCPNPDSLVINFKGQTGVDTSFSCLNMSEDGYVASSSARLTSDKIVITSCSFECVPGEGGVPASVTISLGARDATAQKAEQSRISISTKVFLRTY